MKDFPAIAKRNQIQNLIKEDDAGSILYNTFSDGNKFGIGI